MTLYSLPIGFLGPGLLSISALGTLQSIPSYYADQPVVSVPPSNAVFQLTSGMPALGKGGVLQNALYTLGGTGIPQIICSLGNATTAYSATEDVFGPKTFVPLSSTSRISFKTVIYSQTEQATVYSNLYINQGSPVATNSTKMSPSGTVLSCSCRLQYNMQSPGTAFDVSLCVFGSGGAQNKAGAPNDFLEITEALEFGGVLSSNIVAYPYTQDIVGASTVQMLSVPCSTNSSLSVFGLVSFWDTANLTSNSIKFFFVAQRSIGNISISQSNFFYQSSISASTSITITADTGTQSAIVSGVGLAGSTWQCQIQYTVVNS